MCSIVTPDFEDHRPSDQDRGTGRNHLHQSRDI